MSRENQLTPIISGNEGQDEEASLRSASLAKSWAKKYVQKLTNWEDKYDGSRKEIIERLLHTLRSNSAQGWVKTESLLGKEVQRQGIDPSLIDPWQISQDVHDICAIALWSYAENTDPKRLSVLAAAEIGAVRKKYTEQDPRVIGFVSMQLFNTRQYILQPLPPQEKAIVAEYFKVIDDLLYMPLQRAYSAAAKYDYDSPLLEMVRKGLPLSSDIAHHVCHEILKIYPNYQCYSGNLQDQMVLTSSIRDVEMFQIYLWVCVLENNVESIQEELFPLCTMLYPCLKVRWKLVQEMIHLIGEEMRMCFQPEQEKLVHPYFAAMTQMFSPEVFPDIS